MVCWFQTFLSRGVSRGLVSGTKVVEENFVVSGVQNSAKHQKAPNGRDVGQGMPFSCVRIDGA